MTKLLIKLFIKNSENIGDTKVRTAYGTLSGVVGICTNFILFLGKLIVGTLSNSIAITADAINNISDAASSLVTLIGFKLAGKPADSKHPFGHARIEYLAGMAISVLVLFIGIELGKTSIIKIIKPEETLFSFVMLGVLLGSILVKLWQGLFYKTIGKKIGSTAIEASATDSISDVISTSAVVVAAVISKLTGVNLDAYIGLGVAAFIVYSGIKLIGETVSPILGQAPDDEFVQKIHDKITAYEGVLGIHDLMVHSYGPGYNFASVHIEVSASENILESHDIIDNIERDFMNEMGLHLVGHLDPIVIDDPVVNEFREFVQKLVKEIDPMLSIHDFRAVVGTTHTNLIFDVTVPYEVKLSDDEIVNLIDKKVKERDSKLFVVLTIDRSYVSTHLSK